MRNETELLITQGRADVGPLGGGGQVNMRKRGRANERTGEGGTAVANRHLRWNFRDEKVMRKGRQLRCEGRVGRALLLFNCAIEGSLFVRLQDGFIALPSFGCFVGGRMQHESRLQRGPVLI